MVSRRRSLDRGLCEVEGAAAERPNPLIPHNPTHLRGAGNTRRAHHVQPATREELRTIVDSGRVAPTATLTPAVAAPYAAEGPPKPATVEELLDGRQPVRVKGRRSGVRLRSGAAGLAVVCVVATGCSGTDGDAAATPAGAGTPPSASAESSPPDAVVIARKAHLSNWAFDGAGAMLGIWARGWDAQSPEALVVRMGDGRESSTASSPGTATNVVANLPKGWLVNTGSDDEYQVALVGYDASSHVVSVSGAMVTPRAGDVAVVFRNRVLVYRPADDTLHAVEQPPLRWRTSAYVTPDGGLVVVGGSADVALWARFDNGQWTRGRWPSGESVGATAANGNDIVVTLGGPTVDGVDSTPVAGLVISEDGGESWREVALPPHLDEALSAVLTDDGTAFISTGTGPLLRVRPGDGASVVRSLRPVAVSAVGNSVYALDVSGRRLSRERALVSHDHGRSWAPAALPGRDGP